MGEEDQTLDHEQKGLRDTSFLKWFLTIGSALVIGLGGYLFNLTINNQSAIREALIEIKNIRERERKVSEEVKTIMARFHELSRDSVHGWGMRWSRSEAERENTRQDKMILSHSERLELLASRISSLNVEYGGFLGKADARMQSLEDRLATHLQLGAHLSAERRISRLEDRQTTIDKHHRSLEMRMEEHMAKSGKMIEDKFLAITERMDTLIDLLGQRVMREAIDGEGN